MVDRKLGPFTVQYGDHDVFDEVIVRDVEHVHVERMANGHVWMKIESRTGDSLVLNFATRNGQASIGVGVELEPSPRPPCPRCRVRSGSCLAVTWSDRHGAYLAKSPPQPLKRTHRGRTL